MSGRSRTDRHNQTTSQDYAQSVAQGVPLC